MQKTAKLIGLSENHPLINTTKINLFLGDLSIEAQNILRIIDKKDPYTAGHCIRVAMIVSRICMLLGLGVKAQEEIINGAAVHDIGKVVIPDAILLKPGRLTDIEFVTMKSHPEEGAKLLEKMHMDESMVLITKYHHERWDGRGYLGGLKGTETPLGARITTIADSIDAMSTTRCYRRNLAPEVVYNEIKKNRGVMYDPDIVDVILPCWEVLLNGIY